jgi:hypothetical protein
MAYSLGLEVLERIDSANLPSLVRFLLFVVPPASVRDLYDRFKYIFGANDNRLIYDAFQTDCKRQLGRFFQCVRTCEKWEFIDFLIVLAALTRPSLRGRIAESVWGALLSLSLTIPLLGSFVCRPGAASFPLVFRLFEIIVRSAPCAVSRSAIAPMASLAMAIIHAFSEGAVAFIGRLISYAVEGPGFTCSVAITALLQVEAPLLAAHANTLDEIVSQSGSLPRASLHVICELMAIASAASQRHMLIVSLTKRLFHHSQVLVEAGVAVAAHLVRAGAEESPEILRWVLQAMKMNAMVVKPSVLLSVIDLIRMRKDDAEKDRILNFCLKVIDGYELVTMTKTKMAVIGADRGAFAVSLLKIPSEEHAEVCAEAVVLCNELLPDRSTTGISAKYDSKKIHYLLDLESLSFHVPDDFVRFMAGPRTKVSARAANIVVVLRAFILPLVARCQPESAMISFWMEIVGHIDAFFEVAQLSSCPSILESHLVFPPEFVFMMLTETTFDFPDDLLLVSLMLRSLRMEFIDEAHSRHYFDGPVHYLKAEMPQQIPLRIVTIIQRLLEIANGKSVPTTKMCIRASSDGLDFIAFCSTFMSLTIDFENDILPLFDSAGDVGVVCRLLIFGLHLGVDPCALSEVAVQRFDAGFHSDLGLRPVLFPLGLPDITEIVRPGRPGSNWRLSVYLLLRFSEFEQFARRFMKIIGQITDEKIEVQVIFVLMDILTMRLSEFGEFFPECVQFVSELVKLVLDKDPAVLRALLKLLKALNKMKAPAEYEDEEVVELYHCIDRSFRRFGNMDSKKNLQRLVADVKGECAMLAFGDVSHIEAQGGPHVSGVEEIDPFRIPETTDEDVDPRAEEEEESS